MKKLICKECGEIITHELDNWCLRKLKLHVEKYHQMTFKKYVIKHEHNGVEPVCKCGCGTKLAFMKSKFPTYYKDHKNKVTGVYKSKNNYQTVEDRIIKMNSVLSTVNLTTDDLKKMFNDWESLKVNANMISETTGIDWRTIKVYWKNLGFWHNTEDFRRISKKHQHAWGNRYGKHGGKKIIDDDLLNEIYIFLQKNKGRYTLNEIHGKFDIKHTTMILYHRLIEKFKETEIKECLKLGNSSKPETEFFNVLRFYFKDISKQFRLENKIYDIKLGDKILIEFDGTYWHSLPGRKESDKIKNEISKRNGYTLIRVKDTEAKNLEILQKIAEIYENQIKRS